MGARILIVDDNTDFSKSLKDRLITQNHDVMTVANGEDAIKALMEKAPDLLLLDLQLPKVSGMDVLKRAKLEWPELPIVVISALNIVSKAVQAMKVGANDFITKPLDIAHLDIAIKKAIDYKEWKSEKTILRNEIEKNYSPLFCENKAMKELHEMAQRVAISNATVLLTGESGTGKEVFARKIHEWSPRNNRMFYPINCVAMPKELLESELFGHEARSFPGAILKKGKFEQANGGTVFLDEIGDMDISLQAKLLRFLQERKFERVGGTTMIPTDIRVIAATNRDLGKAVAEGEFREDLFFRLNVVPIHIPPLRDRPEDIIPLATYFLSQLCKEAKKPNLQFAPETIHALKSNLWPGNVRTLRNVIEKSVILKSNGSFIEPSDLSLESLHITIPKSSNALNFESSFHDAIEHYKKQIILNALARSGGKRTKAAELLGLQRTHFSRLISKHLGQGDHSSNTSLKPPEI